ncbi:hypothetical protein EHS39_09115 [Ensifer sp. MPMI2T]|nr:hypothetical protein EHS39_09115 [Ensifer sp. MPMI2T]
MSPEVIFGRLLDRIERLERVVQRQSMRINNMIREAKVMEVDYEKGLAIVEAHGVESKPIPWLQQAGDIVDWDPPAVGQRMMMFSPTGDIGRGFLLPGGYTESVRQPHQTGASWGRNLGNTKIFADEDSYDVETGTFYIKANIVIEGDVTITGSTLTHNGVNVGSTHKHKDSMPGPAQTGTPV